MDKEFRPQLLEEESSCINVFAYQLKNTDTDTIILTVISFLLYITAWDLKLHFHINCIINMAAFYI